MKPKVDQRPTAGESPDEPPDLSDLYRIREQMRSDPGHLGLRDRNKLDKFERISAAARRQFAEKGYDGTTLRDIAREAHVALGTLGFYAENKRDLVLLIFNETLPQILAKSRANGIYRGSLVDALTDYFQPVYAAYAKEPELYRTVLRENVFHAGSQHAREFHRVRLDTIATLQGLIRQAQAAGEVRSDIDLDLSARAVFFLFFAAVRWWISRDRQDLQEGLDEIRMLCTLLLNGMKSEPL